MTMAQRQTANRFKEYGWRVEEHDDGRVTATGPSFGVAVIEKDGSVSGMTPW